MTLQKKFATAADVDWAKELLHALGVEEPIDAAVFGCAEQLFQAEAQARAIKIRKARSKQIFSGFPPSGLNQRNSLIRARTQAPLLLDRLLGFF